LAACWHVLLLTRRCTACKSNHNLWNRLHPRWQCVKGTMPRQA